MKLPLRKTSDKPHLTRPLLQGFYLSVSEYHQGYIISYPVVGSQRTTAYEITNKLSSPKISINIQRGEIIVKQTWKQEVLKRYSVADLQIRCINYYVSSQRIASD